MTATCRIPSSRRALSTTRLLELARIGYSHALFGNLYEAIAKVPDRMAVDRERAISPLSPGSPVRYHLPGVPITTAATVAAAITGWQASDSRVWLTSTAACWISDIAMTAYLVRTVNLKLFFGDPPSASERERLLRTWYRVNVLRLVALCGAWLTARQAARHSSA